MSVPVFAQSCCDTCGDLLVAGTAKFVVTVTVEVDPNCPPDQVYLVQRPKDQVRGKMLCPDCAMAREVLEWAQEDPSTRVLREKLQQQLAAAAIDGAYTAEDRDAFIAKSIEGALTGIINPRTVKKW